MSYFQQTPQQQDDSQFNLFLGLFVGLALGITLWTGWYMLAKSVEAGIGAL
jgi:hypothetical protein